MAIFEIAINTVLQHEGIFSNDKNDRGGATKYGISLRYLKSLHDIDGESGDLDKDGDVDIDDIHILTKEDAINFYKQNFWLKNQYGKINDQKIATKIFDLCVNMGASRANRILQDSCNVLGPKYLIVDGIIGKKTLKVVNDIVSDVWLNCLLLREIRWQAANFYKDITRLYPSNLKFFKGWLKRAMW